MSWAKVNKIQRVQNTATRIFMGSPSNISATHSLGKLHWLTVSAQTDCKITSITYKVLSLGQQASRSKLRDLVFLHYAVHVFHSKY